MPFPPSLQLQQVIPAGIFVTSMAVLGISLLIQFCFTLTPCILCLYQRIPYAVAAILAGVALGLSPTRCRVLVALCGVAFGINTGIALYQLGVENHWWLASACSILEPFTLSVVELRSALEQPVEVSCDVVQWSLFGLSLSGYNLLVSLGLATICFAAVRRKRWWSISRST